MANKRVVWSKTALRQFDAAIKYITSDSFQNAEKVKLIILENIDKIPDFPEKYPPDKYKQNNKGNYRAFEIYHYRISYYTGKSGNKNFTSTPTSMEPKEH